jgi:hypothetical protein
VLVAMVAYRVENNRLFLKTHLLPLLIEVVVKKTVNIHEPVPAAKIAPINTNEEEARGRT